MEIQKPKLFDAHETSIDNSFPKNEATSRQSPFSQKLQWVKNNYDKFQVSAMAVELDTSCSSRVPIGSVVSAVEAKNWSRSVHNCDIRPRLLDKSTGVTRLVDSGSQITAT